MKVFLSQSGPRARAVAELLNEWLPNVIQSLQPWYSVDIGKGTQWLAEVSSQLNEAAAGIVCVTKQNRVAPWIMFEAGALAKGLSANRVCTLVIDLEKTDLGHPLTMFQATAVEKDDMWRLVKDLNSFQPKESQVAENRVRAAFEKFWGDFTTRFEAILKAHPEKLTGPVKTDSQMIGETLEAVRDMQRMLSATFPNRLSEEMKSLFSFDDDASAFSTEAARRANSKDDFGRAIRNAARRKRLLAFDGDPTPAADKG
ncbi:MAG: toll-Interleukin receptor [Verrucomicrobiota bacterium]